MRPFRTDPPTDFRSYPLKILLDADIGKLHTQRIRDRQEWDEKVSFLAKVRHTHT